MADLYDSALAEKQLKAELKEIEQWRRRLGSLKLERSSWLSHWQDLSQYYLPRRGRFLVTDRNRGERRNTKIIDGEGSDALNVLVSGIMTGVTSSARRWFRIETADKDLMEYGPVKAWLRRLEDLVYDIFARSNLYDVLPSLYEDMALYGQGAMIHLDDYDDVSRFQTFATGEYCIAQDHQYRVNAIYREVQMTVEQIVHQYAGDPKSTGERRWGGVSTRVQDLFAKGNYDEWIDIVHLIEQNQNFDPKSKLKENKKFASVCFEAGSTTTKLLHRGGFDRFPVYVPRWYLQPPDVYARSPGMEALGDVKQLQDQHKKKGQALAKMVNPPMRADGSLKKQRLTTLPGDVSFVDMADNKKGFEPTYTVNPNLQHFVLDMEDVRKRIRRRFFADVFMAISMDERNQRSTAEEIIERRSEKMLVLGPVLSRINHDLLDPMVGNQIARVFEADLMPPPPRELQNSELKTEYVSMLMAAQRSQNIVGINDVAAFVGKLAAINPEVIDKFDFDQAVDEYSDMRGVPPGIVRPDDQVEALRGQRQQMQAQQQAIANATEAAKGAELLSRANTSEPNLLADMMAGMGTR